jgi:hypothetical protein
MIRGLASVDLNAVHDRVGLAKRDLSCGELLQHEVREALDDEGLISLTEADRFAPVERDKRPVASSFQSRPLLEDVIGLALVRHKAKGVIPITAWIVAAS